MRTPDSVMYTLSSFRRRLVSGDVLREGDLESGTVSWLPAQQHHGEDIGQTPTHVVFVELKEPGDASEEKRGSTSEGLGPEEAPDVTAAG
jgi:hypothetical protein